MNVQPFSRFWLFVGPAVAMLTVLTVVSCGPVQPPPILPDGRGSTPSPVAVSASEVSGEYGALLAPDTPDFDTAGWRTDFSRRTVEWDEILSGGPPKDGIPSIDSPTFGGIADAQAQLGEREPVIVFAHNGDVRAYPLSILIWHEIVNDRVGDRPVSVTFCPLCNASIVFDRNFGGQVLDFGTTGRLRNSDLIMYDRQTETWWQQFTGEGIVGEYAGRRLTFLPSQVLSFGDFAATYPDGLVMEIPTEFSRRYGNNPYVGYDSTASPFLFSGQVDPRLPAMERIVGVDLDGEVAAYPFSHVARLGAINDDLAKVPIVVWHKEGTASALDSSAIAEGRDVGSVGVFSRVMNGQVLTFSATGDGHFVDAETGTSWDIAGRAIEGELSGSQLERILSFDHFWFAWAAFHPQTALYGG